MVALVRHPASKGGAVRSIDVSLQKGRQGYRLIYILSGDLDRIRLPERSASPTRRDGLWQTSVFEAFFRSDGDDYVEMNFSPSLDFAAYRFDDYRDGMRDAPIAIKLARAEREGQFTLDARFVAEVHDHDRLCLSAIIEEVTGEKSYWALAHTDGPPDFHHPSCFAIRLADIAGS